MSKQKIYTFQYEERLTMEGSVIASTKAEAMQKMREGDLLNAEIGGTFIAPVMTESSFPKKIRLLAMNPTPKTGDAS